MRSFRGVSVSIALAVMLGTTVLMPAGASATVVKPTYTELVSGSFLYPMGLAESPDGNLFVADYGHGQIQEFVAPGMTTWTRSFGVTGVPNGPLYDPQYVAVTRDSQYEIVADTDNNRIQVFDSSGNFVRSWGSTGSAAGQLLAPTGVAVDEHENVYVSDLENDRVQKFRLDGTFVRAFDASGTPAGKLHQPQGITVAPDGSAYVVDGGHQRVVQFTQMGSYVATIGAGVPAPGFGPQAIAADARGGLWVTDLTGNRVIGFSAASRSFATTFGAYGTGDGRFQFPMGIAVTGNSIWVSDANNNRVQRWLPGDKPVNRVQGANRYDVAAMLAKTEWPGYKGIKHVIVVCGEDRAMADPLSAAGLAGVWKAPVLLTTSASLQGSTKAAVKSMRAANGPLKIHVIGGIGSVSPAAYAAIKATNSGGTIDRISAPDRYGISLAISKRMVAELASTDDRVPGVLVINVENPAAFYDALAASPIAAKQHMPLIGVKTGSVPAATKTALRSTTFAGVPKYAVSGASYISAGAYTAAGCSDRLNMGATDRYATAKNIAWNAWANGWLTEGQVAIASKIPDALTGGSFVGLNDGALLYCTPTSFPTITSTYLYQGVLYMQTGWVFGGPGSVNANVMTSFAQHLND